MQTGFALIKGEARSVTGKELFKRRCREPQRQRGKCVLSIRYSTAAEEKIKVTLQTHEKPKK